MNMTKKALSPATLKLDLEKGVTVVRVGLTDSYAWIRFSNGMRFDLSREQLEAIVSGYEEMKSLERLIVQIGEEESA